MPADLDVFERSHDPLPAVRKQLAREFGSVASQELIDEAAEEAVHDFDGATVRTFVPILAFRRARQRLRRGAGGPA